MSKSQEDLGKNQEYTGKQILCYNPLNIFDANHSKKSYSINLLNPENAISSKRQVSQRGLSKTPTTNGNNKKAFPVDKRNLFDQIIQDKSLNESQITDKKLHHSEIQGSNKHTIENFPYEICLDFFKLINLFSENKKGYFKCIETDDLDFLIKLAQDQQKLLHYLQEDIKKFLSSTKDDKAKRSLLTKVKSFTYKENIETISELKPDIKVNIDNLVNELRNNPMYKSNLSELMNGQVKSLKQDKHIKNITNLCKNPNKEGNIL